MLDAIRKRSASILVKLLFGLLILSFAAWGIGDVIRGGVGEATVATVGDLEVPAQEIAAEVQREMSRLRAASGGRIDAEQARALGVIEAVVGRVVERTLVDLAAWDLGLTVSDTVVRNQIQSMPEFRGSLGTFDRERFHQLLYSNGWTEDRYVALVRQDLARRQLMGSVAAGVTVPEALVDTVFRHRGERRIAETVRIADTTMPDPGQPDTEALDRVHRENADRFTAPELRRLTVVTVMAEDLAKEIAVPEADVQAAFEERADEFRQPERRTLEHIRTDDEATARRAHEELLKGRDFAEVGREVAGLEPAMLALGTTTRDQLLPALANASFDMPRGGISPPVQSPLGWHVLRVVGIERAREQPLEEVRAVLAAELAREKAIDALFDLSNRLEDALAGGATLEEAAASLDLALTRIDAIDPSGSDANGNPIARLPPGDRFLPVAFATEDTTQSPLTEAGDDGYFVLRVDAVTPPALRPLADVRDQVAELWRARQRAEAAEQAGRQLIERLEGGAALSAVAAERGLAVTTTEPFTRAGDGAGDLPDALLESLFSAQPGDAAQARADGATVVARLVAVRAANPSAEAAAVEAVRREMVEAVRGDVMAQLSAALRVRYPVSINPNAVQQFY